MSVNKVILIGRLGDNPELKYTQNQTACTRMSLATSESWNDKNSGQKQERTEWHRVIVWGKLGELCNQYLAKGRQVYVEGKLQTRSWDDQHGQKRYTTEIVATTVQFIGGATTDNNQISQQTNKARGENKASSPSKKQPEYQPQVEANFASDDIPF